MKKNFSVLFLIAINFIASTLISQTDTVINGKRYKIVDEKKPVAGKKIIYPSLDSIFVVQNKRFAYYNNWLTVGLGANQNLSVGRSLGFAGGIDYNFHIKQHYFQSGIMVTGEKFGNYDNYEFHLGYGKRFEDKDFHFAAFAGVSYSSGFLLVGDSVYSDSYNAPGLYIQAEVVKKITYDVGIGGAFYVDWNQEQSIFGARFILYFSGAYKGKQFMDGKDPD